MIRQVWGKALGIVYGDVLGRVVCRFDNDDCARPWWRHALAPVDLWVLGKWVDATRRR